mmetsp:Transcript_23113/g.58965  ORF Transcript_23113/g.58965 Transcript_23113/m.58965 type:complete len:191 (+) Transcript_23113:19-591(+)
MPRGTWASVACNSGPVDHADVKSGDVELFVIRCPPGFDATRLHGTMVQLSEHASSLAEDGDDEGFVLRPTPACESQGLACAFPSSKKQRYVLGKTIARQFAVSERVAASVASASAADDAPPPPLPPVPQIPGLRLRHSLVGQGEFLAPAGGSATGASHKRSSSASATGDTEAERRAAKVARKAEKAAKKK